MIFKKKLAAFGKEHELKYNFNESDCSSTATTENLSLKEMDMAAEDLERLMPASRTYNTTQYNMTEYTRNRYQLLRTVQSIFV